MPKVIYIIGSGRNGSTLLSRLLGQVPGCCAVGEVRSIWTRLIDDNYCGCGQRFSECPFWSRVVERAFGDDPDFEPTEVRELALRLDRIRKLPTVMRSTASDDLARLRRLVSRLYEAIAVESGCDLIVDSSKTFGHLAILQGIPGIEVIPVHLVRDPRGVAYSWAQKKERPDHHRGATHMRQYSPARTAMMWYLNLLADVVPAAKPLAVRYEDLATEPRRILETILDATGKGNFEPLTFLDGHTADLAPVHSVAGNPSRMSTGPIEITLDEEWRRSMRTSQRLTVTCLSAPLLVRYGYWRRP
jgi:hypothetical protein